MRKLSIKELRNFRDKKIVLRDLENILSELYACQQKPIEKRDRIEILETLTNCISDIELKIELLKKDLCEIETDALNTIALVEDDVAKQALLFHYCDCICWDVIAEKLGGWKNGIGVKSVAHRSLKRIGTQYKKRGRKSACKTTTI